MFKIKKNLFVSLVALVVAGMPLTSLAATNITADTSAYRQYKEVTNLDILVPTVVDLPLESTYLERADFAVESMTDNSFSYYYYKRQASTQPSSYLVYTNPSNTSARYMVDDESRTSTPFELEAEGENQVTITLTSTKLGSGEGVTASGLSLLLDKNVALPTSIDISALVNSRSIKVLAKSKMTSQTVRFPKTTSSHWTIVLTYAQPLRISELKLIEENVQVTSSHSVRFLAQPNTNYRVYFDADRPSQTGSYPVNSSFSSDKDVLFLPRVSSKTNLLYKQADIDSDGIPDILDNCVREPNKDQEDINKNGVGDVCEDFDRDGIANSKDNCPNLPNRYQRDTDSDGIGDECDTEESRITEKHKWIPWLGIVFALIVIVVLFIITARSSAKPEEDSNHNEVEKDNEQNKLE